MLSADYLQGLGDLDKVSTKTSSAQINVIKSKRDSKQWKHNYGLHVEAKR